MEFKGFNISETNNNRAFPFEVTGKSPSFLRRFKTVAAAKAAITKFHKTGYFA